MIRIAFMITLICCSLSLIGQTYESGEVYKGTNDYITYHSGNLPIIISVSHGGLLDPSAIPDRSCLDCVTGNDTNTKELGESIKDRIKTITGCDIHMVVNELRRRKLDANREIGEAALGNVDAELAWTEFHAFIDSAKVIIDDTWNRGLVVDLHGHGHDIQRLELGYRLSGSELRKTDSELDMSDLAVLPIRTLVNETELSLSQLLRGEQSLGTLFDQRGYDAVPSSAITEPDSGDPYFRGGYITDRYGSKDGSSIDAIQIECHQDVRFTDNERNRFADSVAVVLLDYINMHYHNIDFATCTSTSINGSISVENVEVYPNPVCGQLTIDDQLLIRRSMILNSLGEVVYRGYSANKLDLSHLNNGIYFLFIESSSAYYRQRIVIHCN